MNTDLDLRRIRGDALMRVLGMIKDQRRRSRGKRRMMFASCDGVRFVKILDSECRPVIDYHRLVICADGEIPTGTVTFTGNMIDQIVNSGVDVAIVRHYMP